jgi:hypothetical protein
MDVVVLNARDRPTVLRNVSAHAGRWLGVLLIGTRGSRDAIGAKVWVEAAGRRWFAEVLNGRGYQGHFGRRLHFGLGDAPREVRLEVKWLGGETTVIETVSCDRVVTVVEPLPGASMATGVPR